MRCEQHGSLESIASALHDRRLDHQHSLTHGSAFCTEYLLLHQMRIQLLFNKSLIMQEEMEVTQDTGQPRAVTIDRCLMAN